MPLYEEVEIEDMSYDPTTGEYTYPCPCGDIFKITLEDLWDGEDMARCPSCTLYVEVIYEEEDLPPLPLNDDDENDEYDDEEAEQSEEEDEEDDSTDVAKEQGNDDIDAVTSPNNAHKDAKKSDDTKTTIKHNSNKINPKIDTTDNAGTNLPNQLRNLNVSPS